MGRFDGYLLCSDWDGTITDRVGVVDRNREAIRYFIKNGGLFTVVSGRYPSYLTNHLDGVPVNTDLIGLNGALVIDHQTGEVVSESFTDDNLFTLIDEILALDIPYQDIYFSAEGDIEATHYSAGDYRACRGQIMKRRYYKAILRTDTDERGERGVRLANTLNLFDYEAVRSWNVSLELLKTDANKASAVLRLKEKTGAKKLVCVGDFENDLSMLRAADISFAVGGSLPAIVAAATSETVPASEGAVAAVIYGLPPLII